ncbi:outer membrane insertion C- signal [Labilibacter sediminis]|nr:outer membrane insertion C- signal [Labilibacter sediminis]
MKKLIIIAVLFMGIGTLSNAQEVGIRFGSFGDNNVAIDGIFSLGEFSRIHADVSFGDGVGIDALWDFIYKPLGDVQGLNWYTGAGATTYIGSNFNLGVAGEVGLEYRFDFPMAIGLDWRPYLNIIEDTDFIADSFGLNIRYVF